MAKYCDEQAKVIGIVDDREAQRCGPASQMQRRRGQSLAEQTGGRSAKHSDIILLVPVVVDLTLLMV